MIDLRILKNHVKNHVVYRISAPSPEEKEEWMKSIRCARAHWGGAWAVGRVRGRGLCAW